MFDIGFFELLMVAVVALLVLGPDKLPNAARMAGAWINRFRRGFIDLKYELEQEVLQQEMKQRQQMIQPQNNPPAIGNSPADSSNLTPPEQSQK